MTRRFWAVVAVAAWFVTLGWGYAIGYRAAVHRLEVEVLIPLQVENVRQLHELIQSIGQDSWGD